jgi:hypothetical protein
MLGPKRSMSRRDRDQQLQPHVAAGAYMSVLRCALQGDLGIYVQWNDNRSVGGTGSRAGIRDASFMVAHACWGGMSASTSARSLVRHLTDWMMTRMFTNHVFSHGERSCHCIHQELSTVMHRY